MRVLGLAIPLFSAVLLAAPALGGPLHDAARTGDGATMQSLLRGGADINEQDENGETPLFAAAKGGQYSTHDQLLVAGADSAIRDNHGLTVMHAAAMSGNANVLAGLVGEDHRTPQGDVNDNGNDRGVTPLFVGAEANHANVVAYLYGYGADPNIPDKEGYTALTRAGQQGYEEVIALLIGIGAVCQDIDPAWKAECDKRKAALGK